MIIKSNYINYIIILYLICYVIGPAPINIFVTLLSLLSILIIFKNLLSFKIEKENFFILVFIIYIVTKELFSANFNYDILSTLRYLIIFISLYFIKSEKIKSNYFISLFILLIVIDGYLQFFHGTNILGYSKYANVRLTGFFNDEPILGSFLMKFIFPFLGILYFVNKKYKILFLIFIVSIYLLIFLTGERMAFIQSTFGIILILFYLFFTKNISFNIKSYLTLIFIIIGFVLIILSNKNINDRYKSTIHNILNINDIIYDNEIKSSEKSYILNFYTGLKLFSNKPIFGNGFRYYNTNCKDEFDDEYLLLGCSTHPHNIYIEILSDHGLIGLIIFILFLFNLFIKNFSMWNSRYFDGFAITSLVMSFPLFTSQSIFSSHYGSIFFLFIYLTYLNSKAD
jgi:O-antigen ligase